MNNTGVYATNEELEKVKLLVEEAERTPVILIGYSDLSGNAWQRVKEKCHEYALAHGLPEIIGYYGLSEKGEFICNSEDEEEPGRTIEFIRFQHPNLMAAWNYICYELLGSEAGERNFILTKEKTDLKTWEAEHWETVILALANAAYIVDRPEPAKSSDSSTESDRNGGQE